jgi:hypothetical protein
MRKELKFYRAFTHIGPVFKSNTLVSSYHVIVSVHHPDNTNEEIDLTDNFQNAYYLTPWKIHLLFKKFYIRNVTSALGKDLRRGIANTSDTLQIQLKQISEFLNEEVALRKGDSVWCGFVWKKYFPAESVHKADTVFYLPIPITYD